MDFKQILKLSKSINYFEDAQFHSIVNDNVLLIKNKKNDSIWKADYRFEEDKLIIDTTNAEMVSEDESAKTLELKDIAKKIARESVINGDKSIYDEVKKDISSCSMKKKNGKEKKIKKEIVKEFTPTYESISKKAKELVNNIYEKYQSAINENRESLEEFLKNSAFMFDEASIVKGVFLDPEYILECYKSKFDKRKMFLENVDKFAEFETKVKEVFETNEIPLEYVNKLFEGLEIGSDIGLNPKITKNLLAIKKDKGINFNVAETTKELKALYEDIFSDYKENIKLYQESFGDLAHKLAPERYSYLRMNSTGMQKDDVRIILEEINNAISYFGGMNEEEFKKLVYLRQIVETCYITGNIDGEMILNALQAFNECFIKTKTNVSTELEVVVTKE